MKKIEKQNEEDSEIQKLKNYKLQINPTPGMVSKFRSRRTSINPDVELEQLQEANESSEEEEPELQ